ncbi:PTS system cellobiose-specific IIA component [Streptococcus gallinaceus]|uniref:PTS lactose/cellobiose transporter subunit IIA n=1 Tax=Streptococcus gallinaceus TaxID=165758 RepID=UPI00061D3F27|nr:PTS lactose/cellobiose transporter subunit IIA [Streptococcus gallinaceus]MCP1638776.1 PTS system cellobiose-specific IIA component [Streptococcus gallinaceus]MCP1769137.1 PTS system cellobiose-specific IIA component [Streptococcus gallinaceus]CRH92983.1 Lactose-specific phosphotransferase enzyme IIA component [Chlamydia trachomatis]
MDQQLEVIMPLIMYGGDAKSSAMEAIQFAKKGEWEEADRKLKEAKDSLIQAHHSQTELLTNEARGETTTLSLLMVHAQDHLMTSITFVDLATEIIELYRSRVP